MLKKIKVFAELIQIEHTLFSLPFAYVGGILAARGIPSFRESLFITLAVFGARSTGMAFNRLIDRYIDERNPRSRMRALPQKKITCKGVVAGIIVFLGILIYASWMLNPMCLTLLPIAVTIILFYSFTKRFTWLSHLILGFCLGLAPVGSWIGLRGNISIEPVLLGLGVTFWTAGFDIIYSTMDYDFDREEGLYSIPACFGINTALRTSMIFHFISFILFIILKFVAHLGWYYLMSLWVIGYLLFRENTLVKPEDLTKVNRVFFRINSLISLTILIFTILDFKL